jgi:hypothetical protein
MDILLIGSASLFVIAGVLYLARNKHTQDTAVIEAARERAAKRARERVWADTKPEVDPWAGRLDLTALNTTETDDRYDGRGALDAEQKRTINVILDGVDVTYVEYVDPWSNTTK